MSQAFHAGVITLFPEMLKALEASICGRAIQQGILKVDSFNPRDYSREKHRIVDDRPYGGGPGMVMMVQPLRDTIAAAKSQLGTDKTVIYLSPQGEQLTQSKIVELAQLDGFILLAGRYEGIDERVRQRDIDYELSIGDYVISGGELAAMTVIDAVTRLLPGALGDEKSAEQDSFMNGLLDHPHYTRPDLIDDQGVPSILRSGDHKAIALWRRKQALGRTMQRRPSIIEQQQLTPEDKQLLREYLESHCE